METVRNTELLQAVLMDHNARTARFGALTEPDLHALGYNPVCGDRYEVFMELTSDRVDRVRFEGFGCVISRASASIMAESLEGLGAVEAMERIGAVRRLLSSGEELPDWAHPDMDALLGVRRFPRRMKCVSLAWHTARAALEGEPQVTTE